MGPGFLILRVLTILLQVCQTGPMARRPRLFAPGTLYHVIVRGNCRQTTFVNARDYQAYFERLIPYRKRFGVTVYRTGLGSPISEITLLRS
jgi:hypothetical protein